MKKFLEEFKAFALKGNVMDMAIGVIIGAAFGNIVTALTDSFITPLIAAITGGAAEDGVAIGGQFTINGVAFTYGAFLSAVVNFIIIAFILFSLLKAINKATSLKKKEEEAKPAEDPADVKLLKEVVAILKEQNPEAAKAAEEKLKA
ncbi:MAG: large conductance mechanosensitive channel protein MscL [Solobacterium sp.]|nr:large conductance mechanosensitive channel protein MscL [Solobacterium sp.]